MIIQEDVVQPAEDHLPYWEFSLRLRRADIPRLPDILRSIPGSEVRRCTLPWLPPRTPCLVCSNMSMSLRWWCTMSLRWCVGMSSNTADQHHASLGMPKM